MKKSIVLFFIILGLVCAVPFFTTYNKIPKQITTNLKSFGENKNEFQKVIAHYKKNKNPLKLKAAFFLISNITDMYHYEGEGVIEYRKAFALLNETSLSNEQKIRKWDSLDLTFGHKRLLNVKRVNDYEKLKAELLIKHIDAAFKAWAYPWAKELSFEDFCDYILPYKIYNEEPELWMQSIQRDFKWLPDSMKQSTDAKQACLYINDYLKPVGGIKLKLFSFSSIGAKY